ncbi:DUF1461 domain-containing protein [Candidatus Woesearchaeota archaeon]|nr:DUF1461 domain-containing protein [Candidatus Woesearchaeota archaeon]
MAKRRYALIFLAIILLQSMLYIYSARSVAFDKSFYPKEFGKHGVYAQLQGYDADAINAKVLGYLHSGDNGNMIAEDFFNPREKEHLLDVKKAFHYANTAFFYLAALVFIALLLLFFIEKKEFVKNTGKIFLGAGIINLALMAFAFAFVYFAFAQSFSTFHEMFFEAGTYIFDPGAEKIVLLYPEELFYDAAIIIVMKSMAASIVSIISGYIMLRHSKVREEQ